MTLYIVMATVIAYIESDSKDKAIQKAKENLSFGDWDNCGDLTATESD